MRLPYRLVRPVARIALKIYFRKIYFSGIENLPKDKPIILAANHPTAFLEPCLLACLLPQPLHFLVRGDFFDKPIFRTLLESLQMIPIYRMKDKGIQGVKNNFSTLDIVYEHLKKKHTILILAEGRTIHEKRLRPIQKGAARMALGAIEKYPALDVQIVPLGVNYDDVLSFRSFVMLDIGQPIDVKTYLQNNQLHPAKTIKKITVDLANRLEERVVQIEQPSDEGLVERLLELYQPQHLSMLPIQIADRYPLEQQMQLAAKVNKMPVDEKEALQKRVASYFETLDKFQLTDAALQLSKKATFADQLLLLAGYVPYLLGRILNFLPLYFGKWWADNRVKEVVFYASIKASFALAAYLVYAFFLIIAAIFINQFWLWIGLLLIPVLGYFALYYYEFREQIQQQRQVTKTDSAILTALKKDREKIVAITTPIINSREQRAEKREER